MRIAIEYGALLSAFLGSVSGLTLNPFAPNVYWPGATVPLSVNKIVSSQVDAPISYYDLPFVCRPEDGVAKTALSMDEILRGDRILTSDFQMKMLSNDPCHVLCTTQLDAHSIQKAHQYIKQQYRVEWYVDGLPGATSFATHDRTHKYYSSGFNLGQVAADGRTYLNNHFTFVVKYRHSDNHDETRVVLAFEVYPRSIQMTENDKRSLNREYRGSCEIDLLKDPQTPPHLALLDENKRLYTSLNVTYSYSVYFREDLDIHWADRWDLYFYYSDTRIVWYTTAVSAFICLLLTAVVALILVRTLSIELSGVSKTTKAEAVTVDDDLTGWKLLRADVLRAPERQEALPYLLGTGIQLIVSLVGILIRRKFPSIGLFVLLFAGVFGGYHSGRLHRMFNGDGDAWLKNGFQTALRVPAIFLVVVLVLDFFIWLQGSNVGIPLSFIVDLVGMWLGVSLPLVLIGAYTGDSKAQTDKEVRVSGVPRAIPRQPFYLTFWPSLLISGALPYAATCVELYFIMNAFQLHQDGYLSFIFGSLSLVLLIAILTAMEITITMTYLVLNHEDHRWHWRAFLFGSASTAYIFAHAAFYFLTELRYGFLSGFVYFGYTTVFCLLYGLVQGTLGYAGAAIFVHKIYGSIKAD